MSFTHSKLTPCSALLLELVARGVNANEEGGQHTQQQVYSSCFAEEPHSAAGSSVSIVLSTHDKGLSQISAVEQLADSRRPGLGGTLARLIVHL
jgi:hypothetical protein